MYGTGAKPITMCFMFVVSVVCLICSALAMINMSLLNYEISDGGPMEGYYAFFDEDHLPKIDSKFIDVSGCRAGVEDDTPSFVGYLCRIGDHNATSIYIGEEEASYLLK